MLYFSSPARADVHSFAALDRADGDVVGIANTDAAYQIHRDSHIAGVLLLNALQSRLIEIQD